VTYLEIEKSRTLQASANPRVLNLEQLGWDEVQLVRAWYGLDYTLADAGTRLLELGLGSAGGVVICSAPFRPALELVRWFAERGYTVVYDVLDDIGEMRALGVYCYDDAAEDYLARNADLLVTLSPRLTEKFQQCKNVVMIRDGIDRAPFPQNGASVQKRQAGGALTLGFWGTMWDYNLDVPLLQNMTRERPEWQWEFIGAYDLDPARPSIAQALAAPNVHFHPSVPRETLAERAKQFDVCILPTPVTPFNLARDPLKVYEYLACYKPVVATNLTQLQDMPHVHLSRDAQEFLRNVERAAVETIEPAEMDAYLREQTWEKRTDALWNAIEGLPREPRTLDAPPRGAMTGAGTELDRWQAFSNHLERIARDREQHAQDLERALQQSSFSNKLKRALGGA
jgi:hypothetical protein